MRILIVSNLYPPVVRGGYETGCALVVDHLRARGHDVHVLASSFERESVPSEPDVERTLSLLTLDSRGARRAPLASLRAVGIARRALTWQPDLIYCWNGASIPNAALRVFADNGVPLAFRVEEHWIADVFVGDQFLRELLPARRGPARAAWSLGCRLLNTMPALRLDPSAPLRTAITWNSQAIRRMAPPPPFVETVLERVMHPAPPNDELFAGIERRPAPEPRIAFIGRVTPYKGVDVAIQALALLQAELGTPVSLDVVGPEDGEHGKDLRAMAERLGVGTSVQWHGQTSPEQAAAVLARAHALIVPSTWDEPFGYVMVEGALARVPVVAADVGGISESLHDEEHALLFGRADAEAAARALARTLRETDATAARVQRAYERAQEFRRGPYLERQERFVIDAVSALNGAVGSRP